MHYTREEIEKMLAKCSAREIPVLRKHLSNICRTIWDNKVPAGEHLWSIPAIGATIDEAEASRAIIRQLLSELDVAEKALKELADPELVNQTDEEFHELREDDDPDYRELQYACLRYARIADKALKQINPRGE